MPSHPLRLLPRSVGDLESLYDGRTDDPLRVCRDEAFDVGGVPLDLTTSDWSGQGLTVELQRVVPEVPVLFVSGRSEADRQRRGRA